MVKYYSGSEMIKMLEQGKTFKGTNYHKDVQRLFLEKGKLYSNACGSEVKRKPCTMSSVFLEKEWIICDEPQDSKYAMTVMLLDNNIVFQRRGTLCKAWYCLFDGKLTKLHIKHLGDCGEKVIGVIQPTLKMEDIETFFEHKYTVAQYKLSELILHEE